MAITKMRLVNVISDKEHLEEVLLRFSFVKNFHPELANKIVERVSGLSTLNEANPYADLLSHMQESCHEMGISLNIKRVDSFLIDRNEASAFLKKVEDEYSNIHSALEEIKDVLAESQLAVDQLKNVADLEINFDDLFSCKYLKIRFGRMPKQSVDKLQYHNNRPYLFKSMKEDDKYCWCAYFTTLRYEGEVDNIFSSLHFDRIRIPSFVHGTPDVAITCIKEEMSADKEHLNHVNEVLASFSDKYSDQLCEIYSKLIYLNQTYETQKYAVVLGERVSISGFVPEEEIETVQKKFKGIENLEIEVRPALSDSRLTPPTKLKNNWLVRPFEMFVEMYGVPKYGELDPTPFVALTYTILFGMMFGDLGQGLVLALVGYYFYKKKGMKLGAVGVRIGLSSAIFGTIYGSVFGNEHLLDPMFHALGFASKPIEVLSGAFVMPLLLSAVAIGAVLIMTTISINTVMNLKKKEYGEMLFSQNGLAGLVLYGAVMIGAALQMGLNMSVFTTPYLLGFVVLPILLIFLKEPLTHFMDHKPLFPHGIGGFLSESIFEVLEIALTFLANTMSYLRVGGFVLSHAGMMMVVEVLMHMTGNASFIVFIFGNIFVMCLEGMIVGIQVLRLEFYEMFSRYFSGDGIAFNPLKK